MTHIDMILELTKRVTKLTDSVDDQIGKLKDKVGYQKHQIKLLQDTVYEPVKVNVKVKRKSPPDMTEDYANAAINARDIALQEEKESHEKTEEKLRRMTWARDQLLWAKSRAERRAKVEDRKWSYEESYIRSFNMPRPPEDYDKLYRIAKYLTVALIFMSITAAIFTIAHFN